jgi:regulator of RNase E activity RraA
LRGGNKILNTAEKATNTSGGTDSIIERLKNLELGAITDAIKQMGIDGWMVRLHPVNPDSRVVGRAFTLQYGMEKTSDAKGLSYYNLLEEIQPGDVIILACGATPLANMGENMQHAAKMKGAAGIVNDACNRDTSVIKNYELPVFSRGSAVKFIPSNFKITAYNVPVMCAGVMVHPGDYIVGDIDGIIALPQKGIEIIIEVAEEIMVIEKMMEDAINSGKSMKECQEVIAKKRDIYKKIKGDK